MQKWKSEELQKEIRDGAGHLVARQLSNGQSQPGPGQLVWRGEEQDTTRDSKEVWQAVWGESPHAGWLGHSLPSSGKIFNEFSIAV